MLIIFCDFYLLNTNKQKRCTKLCKNYFSSFPVEDVDLLPLRKAKMFKFVNSLNSFKHN